MEEKKYQILLFYKYVQIENPELEMQKQVQLCEELNLKCRSIVAKEGINVTLEGEISNTEKYIKIMSEDPKFTGIHWKKSEGNGKAFPKISVKVRNEIVTLGLGEFDFNPNDVTGEYITADELHELYESKKEEFYVVDMRNDYEMTVGHFQNAILMPMSNFRELPKALKTIEHLKKKMVITFCTGGVRCEKASGYLKLNGFENVYQLWGGIHSYIEKYPNKYFLGGLYVFDSRVVMGNNDETGRHRIISICEKCRLASELYVDCGYKHCSGRRHFVACKSCLDENGYVFCDENCKNKAYAENKFTKKRETLILA